MSKGRQLPTIDTFRSARDVSIEVNESTPILPPPPKKGFFATYCKPAIKVVASLFSALPNAVFAFAMPSNASPTEISWRWWQNLSPGNKFFSIMNGINSEAINAELNNDFFNQFWERVKQKVRYSCKDAKTFINTILSFTFGIGGGIAAGTIAYEAFAWLPIFVFAVITFNFGVFFVSRYLGMSKVIDYLIDADDIKLQKNVADQFKLLKPEHLPELENALQNSIQQLLTSPDHGTELTEADFAELFTLLGEQLAELADLHPDCLRTQSSKEYAAAYAGTIFDFTYATLMGLFSYMAFTHKAFNGINIFYHLLSKQTLQDLPKAAKVGIGSVGSIPSGALYFLAANHFRPLLIEAASYLYHHPKDIPLFLLRAFASVDASTTMFAMGASVLGGNNLFGIPKNTYTYWLFALGSGLSVLNVNITPTLKIYAPHPHPTHPTANEIIDHFHLPTIHTIKQETLSPLKHHSLFKVKPTKKEAEQPVSAQVPACLV